MSVRKYAHTTKSATADNFALLTRIVRPQCARVTYAPDAAAGGEDISADASADCQTAARYAAVRIPRDVGVCFL